MRILVCTQQLASFRSGVGTYADGLLRGLAARGHRLTVVVPDDQVCDLPGVRVITVRPSRVDPTPGRWFALGGSFARVLAHEARNHDLAHFTDAREAWRLRDPRIPVTGMVNDAYALEWLAPGYPRHLFADRAARALYYRFLRCAEARVYPSLTALVANSRHVAGTLCAGYDIDPARLRVVYYGLPRPSETPAIALRGCPAVLFVGGNFQRKGLGVLFDAASRLGRDHPELCVHVVGRDRNQPSLARLAQKLGIEGRVVFHGFQPNERVRGMMGGADVFALPSLTEGFGLVYLEAMTAGVPVVATSLGGAREVFEDGAEALFVTPNDPAGLALALDRVTADPALAARLRTGGRAAAQRFGLERMVAETETLFAGLLAGRTAPDGAGS